MHRSHSFTRCRFPTSPKTIAISYLYLCDSLIVFICDIVLTYCVREMVERSVRFNNLEALKHTKH